jgi:hypothetical protein
MPPEKTNGAGDEARTRDLHLGKVVLYQLSYSRSCNGNGIYCVDQVLSLERETGFEPATLSLGS